MINHTEFKDSLLADDFPTVDLMEMYWYNKDKLDVSHPWVERS